MTERIDTIDNGLRILQDPDFFAFGTDAVLLSRFVSVYNNDRVIDLGTGTGYIPLVISQRRRLSKLVGLELQPPLVEMCKKTIALNNLEDGFQVVQGDLREVKTLFPPESYDLVTCNPPYMEVTGSKLNSRQPFTIARHEVCCNLEDVVRAFAWLVRYGGKVAMVHRPGRLVDIFFLLRSYNLEPKRMQLVYPRPGTDANILLVEAEKGAKPGIKALPPLILRGD